MKAQPLVSIVIRTCGRPQVLREALESVRKQSYNNIETIVVEDGINSAEKMIVQEFSDLHVNYCNSGVKLGRSGIGNVGLEKCEGKYCNFLDDDDILYENHVEELVEVLENSQYKAAYSIAEEEQIVIKSHNPYRYKIRRKLIRYKQPFNQTLLYHINYIPIQSIMFERSLCQRLGGFDDRLTALEDWDLWVRFSTLERFFFVDKVTSAYRVIYTKKNKIHRDKRMYAMQNKLEKKFLQYDVRMNVGQINEEMDFIVKKYKTSSVKRYLRIMIDFLLYGER